MYPVAPVTPMSARRSIETSLPCGVLMSDKVCKIRRTSGLDHASERRMGDRDPGAPWYGSCQHGVLGFTVATEPRHACENGGRR